MIHDLSVRAPNLAIGICVAALDLFETIPADAVERGCRRWLGTGIDGTDPEATDRIQLAVV
jgi:hypothetical protein